MKKKIMIVLLLLTWLMTACSSGQASSAAAGKDSSLSVQTELMLGTLKLRGTDQEVTAEQAAQLLPLWEVMKDLNSSDTAAQQEIDALVNQINGTMTSGQMQAISDMKLTQQDVMGAIQGQALNTGETQKSSSQSQNSGGFGGPPGGGDMGGILAGGGTGFGSSSSSSQSATPQAMSSNQVPSGLIDTLIDYLKGKASS